MGRTDPTYRDRLTTLEREWDAYRRGLRATERQHFERLEDTVRPTRHRHSAVTAINSVRTACAAHTVRVFRLSAIPTWRCPTVSLTAAPRTYSRPSLS